MPIAGTGGTVLAVRASPGTSGTVSAARHADPPDGRVDVAREALVGARDRHDEGVARLDRRDHPGQRDGDRCRSVGGHRHPQRRDRAAQQRAGAVLGDLGRADEQHRLRGRGLAGHARHGELHPRRARDRQRRGDRGARELRGLAGDRARDGREPTGRRAERATEAGQRRDRGGVAARGREDDLRVAGQREVLPGRRGAGEARVIRCDDRAPGRRVGPCPHPGLHGVGEREVGSAVVPARRATGRTSRRSGRAPPGRGRRRRARPRTR